MDGMRKHQRRTGLVVAMITVSLAGILTVQAVLLKIAWNLKDQAFERNVITALATTVQELEQDEIAGDALKVMYRFGEDDLVDPRLRRFPRHKPDRQFFPNYEPVPLDSALIELDIDTHVTPGGSYRWTTVTADSLLESGNVTFVVGAERAELIHRVVDDLVVQRPRPIRERVEPARIDSLLRYNLADVGIGLAPHFGIIEQRTDSLVLASEADPEPDQIERYRTSRFRSRLFPLDLVPGFYEIALHFPDQRSFLLRSIGPLLAASLLFTAGIVLAFVLTLATIRRQRRFAVGMVDFINNMTHEFKTPISTVSLASEAIGREDIVERPEALQRYNRMIRDENLRMRRQVEKILQLAQLESGDLQLNLIPVDLNELTRDTAEPFALQIEKRGGSLELDLRADRSVAMVDPVHLGNVLTNLIDNAIKYSPAAPQVRVRSERHGRQLVLRVTDHGVGIARADQERVFEKYFRCPTGDRHDVKGFGLGLSFVRLLVEAHGGSVELQSAPGQGTTIILSLPLGDESLEDSGSGEQA